MFSKTNLTSRRQFLERSAWGFGSAFILPSLLASCTDHQIPPSNPPIIPPIVPPLEGIDINWNDAAKTAVTTGLGLIPEAGDILSPLVDILWPSSNEDIWGQIRTQVETLIDQKIADTVYQTVFEDLQGLKNLIIIYLNELKTGNSTEKLILWLDVRGAFAQAMPHFQAAGYEVLLLPLFGQFASMYLSLLRDGTISGLSWGMTQADVTQLQIDLGQAINDFISYTTNTYETYRTAKMHKTPGSNVTNEPFNTVNKYDRQMSFTVLYFMDSWLYYDILLYPNGNPNIYYTREVYTDPVGTSVDFGGITIPSPSPQQRPTKLDIWDDDRVVAFQLTYPANSGPEGATVTPRLGNPVGGNLHELDITLGNPIIQTRTTYGDIVNQVQFRYDGGAVSDTYGGTKGGKDTDWLGYINMALSSIYVNGYSSFYNSANTVVFGFQYWKKPQETLNTIQAIYIRSPKEYTVADFAKSYPNLAIPADLITDVLKIARKAYWDYIETRAKALK